MTETLMCPVARVRAQQALVARYAFNLRCDQMGWKCSWEDFPKEYQDIWVAALAQAEGDTHKFCPPQK